jgi:hypothetical protein
MSIVDSAKLKEYLSIEKKMAIRMGEIDSEIHRLREERKRAEANQRGAQNGIMKLKNKDIVVTEHAILRYLEMKESHRNNRPIKA